MNIEKQLNKEYSNLDLTNRKILLFKKENLIKKIFLNIYEFEIQILLIQNEMKSKFSNEELNYLIQLFFYIISNNKTVIILNDFYKFLKENGINFNISNLKLLFISLNNKNDNLLDLNEFCFLFNFPVKINKFIEKFERNFYFNEYFIKLILLNLKLFENLQILLNTFYNQFKNFTPFLFFNEINNNKNFIEFDDLFLYLKNLNFKENEIKIIFNKIKSSFDSNKINFKQFSKFFNLIKFNSFIKPGINENPFIFDTNEIIKIIDNFYYLSEKEKEREKNKEKITNIENEIFNKIINFIIELDSNVENILKNENFFADKLFKSFIINSEKNSIEKNDFYEILKNKYKIKINKKTLNLIFSKYSNNNFNMNFENFLKLLKIRLKNFDLNKINNNNNSIDENLIKETLELSIKNEIEIENKISKLNKMTNFNLNKIFEKISDGNNFLSKIDLENYFNLNSNQSEILFKRLDFDNDNKISYEDFLKNLYPTFI